MKNVAFSGVLATVVLFVIYERDTKLYSLILTKRRCQMKTNKYLDARFRVRMVHNKRAGDKYFDMIGGDCND